MLCVLKHCIVFLLRWLQTIIFSLIILGASIGCLLGLMRGNNYGATHSHSANSTNKSALICLSLVDMPTPYSQMKLLSLFLSLIMMIICILTTGVKLKFNLSIQNPFRKTRRLLPTIVYAIIAYQLIDSTLSKLHSSSNSSGGLFDTANGFKVALSQLLDVAIVGMHHYPLLVALETKSLVINSFITIYMWSEIFIQIYYESMCKTAFYETISHKDDEKYELRVMPIFKVFICVYMLPYIVLSTFIGTRFLFYTLELYLKAFRKLLIKRRRKTSREAILQETSLNSDFVTNGNKVKWLNYLLSSDTNKLLGSYYCQADLDYTRSRLRSVQPKPEEPQINCSSGFKSVLISLTRRVWSKTKELFLQYIYDPANPFRFSFRFVSMQIVCLTIVYCITMISFITNYMLVDQALQTNTRPPNATASNFSMSGYKFCRIKWVRLLCYHDVVFLYIFEPVQEININFNLWLFVFLPLVISTAICLFQIVAGSHNYKTDLLLLSQGKKEFITKRISTRDVMINSFQFCGSVVGFTIWGHFILIYILSAIVLLLIFARIYMGDQFLLRLLKWILQFVIVFLVKKIINYCLVRFVFLNKNEKKRLTLKHLKLYAVATYFNFYIEAFIGVITAILRIIGSGLLGLFFLSRMGYSFLGRQLEIYDVGYSTYASSLQLEISQSQPLMLSFCALSSMRKMKGLLQVEPKQQRAINKWHLAYSLIRNGELVHSRKTNKKNLASVQIS